MNNILLTNGELYDKLLTHKEGLQHYAFSLFLFNEKNEILIQKRANCKYHSGGLWSNSCCSHFKNIDEFNNKEQTIRNRLKEELGIDYLGDLKNVCHFEYNKNVGSCLIENEFDYIFIGKISSATEFKLNKEEIEDIKFITIEDLKQELDKNTNNYTVWLKLIIVNNLLKI